MVRRSTARTKRMSCSITTIGNAAASPSSRSAVARVSSAVMPAVGSSSSSSFGPTISAMPISSHCLWPCASSPAVAARQVGEPEHVEQLVDPTARSSAAGPRPATSRLSRTVRLSKRLGTWNLRTMPSRAKCVHRQPDQCRGPAKRIAPRVGRSVPARMLKSVLLPAPFGPMMQQSSPDARVKLTPRSTTRPPKWIWRSLA